MEIVGLFVLFGLVGGAVVAVVVRAFPKRRDDAIAAKVSAEEGIEPPTINYSNLKVSGVGGFGLVVVCVAISIAIPEIGLRMLLAAGLGGIVAAVLVYRRRRAPLPSSGARPGANTTLGIEGEGDSATAQPPSRPAPPTAIQAVAFAASRKP